MGRPVDYRLIYEIEDRNFARERAYVCPMWEYVKDQAARYPDWDRLPVQNDFNGEVRVGHSVMYADACVGEIELCTECGHTRTFHFGGPLSQDPDYGCEYGSYLDNDGWRCLPCNCGNNTGR